MGILDALLRLADAQAFTADAYSTNTIDLLAANRDIGSGTPMAALVSIDVAADFTTGDETYTFQLVQSANADLSSHDVIATRTFLASELIAGAQFIIPLAPGTPVKRYLGARFDGSGTTPTVTATIDVGPQSGFQAKRIHHPGVF